jgi:hypothetical protein
VFIRFFACMDDTSLGMCAKAYCDEMVDIGAPVRLVPTRAAELQLDRGGRCKSAWDGHRRLLLTPMVGGYANFVCGTPDDWERFHTHGVRNVLLLAPENLDPSIDQPTLMAAFRKYDAVYAPDDLTADVAERVTGSRPTVGIKWFLN